MTQLPQRDLRFDFSLRLLASCVIVAMLVGCSVSHETIRAQVQARRDSIVTDVLTQQPMDAKNAVFVISSCIPTLNAEAVKNAGKGWQFTAKSPAFASLTQKTAWTPILIYSSGIAYCLPRDWSGQVIFPAEAFQHTLVPEGVSSKVNLDWLMEIAKLYSLNGSASAAYVLPSGVMRIVRYLPQPHRTTETSVMAGAPSPAVLTYSIEDSAAGEAVSVDVMFRGLGLSGATAHRYNASFSKMPFDRPK